MLRNSLILRPQGFTRSFYSSRLLRASNDKISKVPRKTAEEAVNNILYNTPLIPGNSSRRVLSALVTNEPGVLSRVSGILAGRGFNIDSLVVSATDVPDLSRMTIVLHGQQNIVEQARKQLEDMVPVWAVLDYTDVSLIERELLLVRVRLDEANRDITRQSVISLAKLFDGRVVDLTNSLMTIELCAKKSRIDAFLGILKPYGIQEAVRSGIIAVPRSVVDEVASINKDTEEEAPQVDATMLPPG